MKSYPRKALATVIGLLLLSSLSASAQSSRRQTKDSANDEVPIKIMDSTDAQWGMRSVNASIYQGMPMNAVYLERGRTRLPDTFPRYESKPLGNEIVVKASSSHTPNTIRVNGVETPLEKD